VAVAVVSTRALVHAAAAAAVVGAVDVDAIVDGNESAPCSSASSVSSPPCSSTVVARCR